MMVQRRPLTLDLDVINIALIALAAALAYWAPFATFLLAYAVLGPLHYLTEISWLHERRYFSSRLGVLLPLGLALCTFFVGGELRTFFMVCAFGCAYAITCKSLSSRLAAFSIVPVAAFLLMHISLAQTLFLVLLPTLIHVSVFTLVFMLVGAKRSKKVSAAAAPLCYGVAAVALGLITVGGNYTVSSFVSEAYVAFEGLNLEVMNLVGIRNPDRHAAIYASSAGLAVMRIIAFAYTYHYFNWFSKTRVIGWHEVSGRRIFAILVLWLGSVAFYLYDYVTGTYMLLLLSFGHVILEFPLNHLTFKSLLSR